MNMKALSIASIAALAIAGTACSQDTETAEEKAETAEPTPVSAPADDGFNFALPAEAGSQGGADDGFNFAVPSMDAAVGDDGFNLPMDVPTTSGLALPQIDSAVIEDIVPEAEEDEDDDIIRLEP